MTFSLYFQMLLRSPRLFYQGKYVELANEDEFDYPENASAREVARRKHFDRFRNIGHQADNKRQHGDAVDRVITKGLVGKTKVTTNEPHAECIGHNCSPVGRRGVCKTRVFQSPMRSGAGHGSLYDERKARHAFDEDRRFDSSRVYPGEHRIDREQSGIFKTRPGRINSMYKEYPTKLLERTASQSRKRGERLTSSRSSGIPRDVRISGSSRMVPERKPSEDMVVMKPHVIYESQPIGPIKKQVKTTPHDTSNTQSVSLTAISGSENEQLDDTSRVSTRRSVMDIVEEVKRESQLKRVSVVSGTEAPMTPVTNSLETTTDRISDPSVSNNKIPSVTWHSRKLLHPKQTERNQEELALRHPNFSQSVVNNDTLPPMPRQEPSVQPLASEFPPLPSFLSYTDDKRKFLTNVAAASQVESPIASKTSPGKQISQGHFPDVPTTRRPSIQNQSPRKRKLSPYRKPPQNHEKDIVDYEQEMLNSISDEAFQQKAIGSILANSSFQTGNPCVNQKESADFCMSNLTFSPQKTSTPIQSSEDVHEQVRSDRSIIESAMGKRRLRIADSISTVDGSTIVIPDVSNTLHNVSTVSPIARNIENVRENSKDPAAIKAKGFSPAAPDRLQRTFPTNPGLGMRQKPERRRTLSTPASPVFSLTGPGTQEHVKMGAHTAPPSPTSNRSVHKDHTRDTTNGTDYESKNLTTASYMQFQAYNERPKHVDVSPRALLLREIRSRRPPDDD